MAEHSVTEAKDFLLMLKSSNDYEEFEGFHWDDEEEYRNDKDPFEDRYVYLLFYLTILAISLCKVISLCKSEVT